MRLELVLLLHLCALPNARAKTWSICQGWGGKSECNKWIKTPFFYEDVSLEDIHTGLVTTTRHRYFPDVEQCRKSLGTLPLCTGTGIGDWYLGCVESQLWYFSECDRLCRRGEKSRCLHNIQQKQRHKCVSETTENELDPAACNHGTNKLCVMKNKYTIKKVCYTEYYYYDIIYGEPEDWQQPDGSHYSAREAYRFFE